MHILELPKFNKPVEELATSLDCWLYFLRHAQALDTEALPERLNASELRWALENLIMISQNELDRERYESRLKAQLDAEMALIESRDALERGLQAGRQQGRQEGRQQGRQEGLQEGLKQGRSEGRTEGQIARIQSFERLLRQKITAAEQLRMRSLTELEELASRLEAELNAMLVNGS